MSRYVRASPARDVTRRATSEVSLEALDALRCERPTVRIRLVEVKAAELDARVARESAA